VDSPFARHGKLIIYIEDGRTGCKHAKPKCVALNCRTPSRVFKTGGCRRNFPTGASANGIPTSEVRGESAYMKHCYRQRDLAAEGADENRSQEYSPDERGEPPTTTRQTECRGESFCSWQNIWGELSRASTPFKKGRFRSSTDATVALQLN